MAMKEHPPYTVTTSSGVWSSDLSDMKTALGRAATARLHGEKNVRVLDADGRMYIPDGEPFERILDADGEPFEPFERVMRFG